MDQINKGETEERRPVYQILVYDLRTSGQTIRDIVLGNPLDSLTGPLDITEFVETCKIDEKAGTYAGSGVTATSVTLAVNDPEGTFDPLLVRTDPTIDGRFFRSGNVVRIIEGDLQTPVEDRVITFTGPIQGQAGYDRNRTTGRSVLTARAVSRQATFIHYTRTSEEFLIGSSYLEAATSVAVNEMGLDSDEIDFPTFGAALIPHKVVQLVEENPMTMLARIMFLDALIPHFDGEGKLTAVADRATGASARVYVNHDHIKTLTRPASDVEPPTTVVVVGLDATLAIVQMPRQALATLDITTGYFTRSEKVKVYWRDDRTLMANNVELKVFVGVNGGIVSIGGGESIDLIRSGDPDQIGVIGAKLTAKTGFAPWIIVVLLYYYIAAAGIPDQFVGFGSGFTIPVGRIVQAILLGAALFVMSKIGRGSYAFVGDPFEYVYKEIRRGASVEGTGEFDENELVLENHLVSTIAQGDQTSFQQLFRQQAEKHPRRIQMLHDLGLEPNDIFEFQDDGSKYLAVSIVRTLQPDASRTHAIVDCLEVTPDVSLGT
jgi:hypothetical protein